MGNVDVDNWFREGETAVPIAAFNPFIESAVSAATGEDVDATDIVKNIIDFSTYESSGLDAEGTLAFADPGINLEGLGDGFDINLPDINIGIPEFLDVDLPSVNLPEVAIDLPSVDLPEVAVDLPSVNLPEVAVDLPQVDVPSIETPDLPSVETPDLPSVDLPSIGMPQLAGGGMFSPYTTNIDYAPVQLQQLITSPYGAQPANQASNLTLDDFFARNSIG